MRYNTRDDKEGWYVVDTQGLGAVIAVVYKTASDAEVEAKRICNFFNQKERKAEIAEIFRKAGTDKADGGHSYSSVYAKIPVDIKLMLEIGVDTGCSLLAWREIFPQAEIYGVDGKPMPEGIETVERLHLIVSDVKLLDPSTLPLFDLIVDDGSHNVEDVLGAFKVLEENINGWYVIEDVNGWAVAQYLEAFAKYRPMEILTGKEDSDDRVIMFERKADVGKAGETICEHMVSPFDCQICRTGRIER